MSNNLILNFLNFPPNVDSFTDYESKIHNEIENQFNDTRSLLLVIMKSLDVEDKKRFFKIKKFLDKLISEFNSLKTRIFSFETIEGKLSFNHEVVLILDFLIFERLLDFNTTLRNIESIVLHTLDKDYIQAQSFQLHKSLQKLENLINFRKVAHQLTPSDQLFLQFSEDFSAQLSYLESVGVIHQFDELSKPSLLGKKAYYDKLSQLFISTCNSLQKQNRLNIPFLEFVDVFQKRYPNVEFAVEDLDKIASRLSKTGMISVVTNTEQSKKIIIGEDIALQQEILKLAKGKGYITQEELISSLGKSITEIQLTIKKLEDAGLAIEDDDYASGKRIYFPGLETEIKS
ncbi:MAG: hypothetical protein K9W45_01760 [Candidatus Heimdallarchaeum aukensis]|uniref:Uncharacterized protein n=1 Tax=Candidatus Heimdallarchaeum aukensis TaxID=2876573 RepID=A0A9Y1FM37_9ARCH|nr:MAG: hypothetical protein K9W45_01760 [Candidatus Heimdallarchaeum aukensis]